MGQFRDKIECFTCGEMMSWNSGEECHCCPCCTERVYPEGYGTTEI